MSFRRYLSGATADATCVTRVVFLPAQRRTRFHRIIRTTELSVSVNQTERNGDSQRSKANASTYKSACSEWLCRLELLDDKLAGKHPCSIAYLFSLKQKGLRPIPPTVAKHYCIATRIRSKSLPIRSAKTQIRICHQLLRVDIAVRCDWQPALPYREDPRSRNPTTSNENIRPASTRTIRSESSSVF
jgi:hypothetical protein